jgi:ubiquinone/menaquinone biosynthesis C-methylase UbiE
MWVGQVVLAMRANGYNCFGLDFASSTIQMLNNEFPDVPFHKGDIRCLPYEDKSFDGYVSLGVIEHFTEGQDLMLSEAARVVKPGGLIFVSVPALNGWRKFRCRFGLYDTEATDPFFESCLSVEEFELLLINAGFTPVERSFQNTVMTFAQETPVRPLYRYIEDIRYVRGAIDRLLRFMLPKSLFGHMIMVVGQRNEV